MTRTLRTLTLLVVPLVAAAALLASGPTTALAAVTEAAPALRSVIVEVEGDAANGFTVLYADGGAIYPPTDSEARAECGEYDTLRARVRCRTEVRTWYRDLGDLKHSLAYVREHG